MLKHLKRSLSLNRLSSGSGDKVRKDNVDHTSRSESK